MAEVGPDLLDGLFDELAESSRRPGVLLGVSLAGLIVLHLGVVVWAAGLLPAAGQQLRESGASAVPTRVALCLGLTLVAELCVLVPLTVALILRARKRMPRHVLLLLALLAVTGLLLSGTGFGTAVAYPAVRRAVTGAGRAAEPAPPASLAEAAAAGNVEAVTAFLNKGADPNTPDDDGLYPLHWAADLGNTAMTLLLVEHGARLDVRDSDGATPLHRAAAAGQAGVILLLLEKRADITATDSRGETPRDAARRHEHAEAADVLRKAQAFTE